jgi:hypothetical protein
MSMSATGSRTSLLFSSIACSSRPCLLVLPLHHRSHGSLSSLSVVSRCRLWVRMARIESTSATIGFHASKPPSSSFSPPPVQHVRASSCFLSTAARTNPSSCCRSRAGDGSGCAWLGRSPPALPSAYMRQISRSVCHFGTTPLLLRPRRHLDDDVTRTSAPRAMRCCSSGQCRDWKTMPP